jgi:hypothetical protein
MKSYFRGVGGVKVHIHDCNILEHVLWYIDLTVREG